MVVKQDGNYEIGYNPICEIGKTHEDMHMDVGIIRLETVMYTPTDRTLKEQSCSLKVK